MSIECILHTLLFRPSHAGKNRLRAAFWCGDMVIKYKVNALAFACALLLLFILGSIGKTAQAEEAVDSGSLFDHQVQSTPNGDHSVDLRHGSFNYSLPITFPKGRGAATPSLSLNYSSDGALWSNAGHGWSLGLSRITREGPYDRVRGTTGPPTFGDDCSPGSDTFFLNGERLVRDDSDPNRFHTLHENNTIIRAHCNGNRIYRWKIYNKDGSFHFYGGTSISRLHPQGFLPGRECGDEDLSYYDRCAAQWYQSSFHDRNGNTVNYKYEPATQHGKNYLQLKSISWADGYWKAFLHYPVRYDESSHFSESFIRTESGTVVDYEFRIGQIDICAGMEGIIDPEVCGGLQDIGALCGGAYDPHHCDNPPALNSKKLFKRYTFSYENHLHSYLTKVTEYGSRKCSDPAPWVPHPYPCPPVKTTSYKFDYNYPAKRASDLGEPGAGWELDNDYSLSPHFMAMYGNHCNSLGGSGLSNCNVGTGARFMDLNADGWTDVLHFLEYEDSDHDGDIDGWFESEVGYYRLGGPEGFSDPIYSSEWTDPNTSFPFSEWVNGGDPQGMITLSNGTISVDINGDSRVDLVRAFRNEINGSICHRIALNKEDNSGWEASNCNDSRLPEDLYITKWADGYREVCGHGYWENVTWLTAIDQGVRFVDLDGDRLPEIVQAKSKFNQDYFVQWPDDPDDAHILCNTPFERQYLGSTVRIWENKWDECEGQGVDCWELVPEEGHRLSGYLKHLLNEDGDYPVIFAVELSHETPLRGTIYSSKPTHNVGVGHISDYFLRELRDVNADGLPDLVSIGFLGDKKRASLNYGNGWKHTTLRGFERLSEDGDRHLDLNGDGILDFLSVTYRHSTTDPYSDGRFILGGQHRSGLTDELRYPEDYSQVWIRSSDGAGCYGDCITVPEHKEAFYAEPGSKHVDFGIRYVDVNNDGRDDMLRSFSDQRTEYGHGVVHEAWINKLEDEHAGTLRSIRLPFGATLDISYEFLGPKRSENQGHEFPFRKRVVDQTVFTKPSPVNNATQLATTYQYRNGRYDSDRMRFMGFEKVIVNTSGTGIEESIVETIYHTSEDLLGRVENTILKDVSGKLIKSENYIYHADQDGEEPFDRPLHTHTITISSSEGEASRSTKVEYLYDGNSYGNVRRKIEHGDIDLSGDERSIDYIYKLRFCFRWIDWFRRKNHPL